MKSKLLLLSGCLLLALNSCRSDIENVQTDSIDQTTTNLGNTKIHKLLIDGKYTYVNEKMVNIFMPMILLLAPSSLII